MLRTNSFCNHCISSLLTTAPRPRRIIFAGVPGFDCLAHRVHRQALTLFLCVFVSLTCVNTTNAQSNQTQDVEPLFSVRQYRELTRSFIKLSKSENPTTRTIATYNLCRLHKFIVTDDRFPTYSRLQAYRSMAAMRLLDLKRDLVEEKENETEQETGDLLASSSVQYGADDQPEDSAGDWSNLFGELNAAFGPPGDNGPALVALIEKTIDPQFWRSNGGPGTIHYYSPSGVLVIRASQEVHDRVYDLLFKLGARGG